MTSRERMLRAFAFNGPDRLPVFYHASLAGLHVHGQKLLDLFNAYPPDNPISFDRLPAPPPGTLDASGRYHEFRKDVWGATREYRIFGVEGHPCRHAIQGWADAYVFPEIPEHGSAEFERERSRLAQLRRTHCLFQGWTSLFQSLPAFRPFEDVLVDIVSEEPALLDFLDRLTAYFERKIDCELALGADVLFFGDDWGTQQSLLISPDCFRRIFKPRLAGLMRRAKAAGAKVLQHSCGAVYPLYADMVEMGIDGLWHQIALFDAEKFSEEAARNKTLLFLHMDRQKLMPLGTPAEIRQAVGRYRKIHERLGGGAVFYVEIEDDAPWANVEALIKAVNEA